jgi:hypothetical protein
MCCLYAWSGARLIQLIVRANICCVCVTAFLSKEGVKTAAKPESKAILTAAGSSLDKLVSATFILYDESDFAGMNEEWVKWFPTDPPARQGAKLPIHPHGMKISIAVIAEA